jgi:hypothetical protein
MWTLEQANYWIKQGLWPNANITPDPYFNYVSLLLSTTSLGNANNNLFVDSSGAFNPISRNGNTTQGSVTPYGASWSNFFDGSGDYFTVPYTTANFDWYTAGVDFTIEYWFFANSLTGTSYVDGGTTKSTVVGNRSATATTDYWSFGPNAGGTVTFYYFNGGPVAVNSTSTITANSWNHIAMTKTSSGITIFVNGVAQTTTAISGTPQSSASFPITVGQGNNTSYNGYVSNLRIVRGTAIYTGNFTVPTAPLTAVTNTKLLTCQSNRFRDASTNNLTLTVTGNTAVTEFSPFSSSTYTGISYNQSDIQYWSGYFDGSGDNLIIPSNAAFGFGTGDFTIEFWAYIPTWTGDAQLIGCHTAFAGFDWLIQQFSSGQFRWLDSSLTLQSGTVPVTNQWNHYAVTRSGTTLRIFLNGTQTASGTSTANIPATRALGIMGDSGAAATQIGYMSNVRIVKGTAVYTSAFTPPTAPLTAISGTSLLTCQNAAFTDNSTNNFVVTINGNTTVTGSNPFQAGYYSGYFDGSGDYLTVPYSTGLQFPGDFTVECWVFPIARVSTYPCIVNNYSTYTTNGGFAIFAGHGSANTSKYNVAFNGSFPVIQSTSDITYNAWSHIALVRSGSTITLYVNGVANGTATSSATVTGTANSWWVGTAGDAVSGGEFNGYISNLRAVKGAAVYTSAFTPSTTPLTAISGTGLLTCQSGRFIDNSSNNATITVNGNTSIQSFDPFYTSTIASNGGSMYFDGTGDFLSAPVSPAFAFGTSDWTMECWVYAISAPNDCYLMDVSVSGGIQILMTVNGSNFTLLTNAGGSYIYTNFGALPFNQWVHLAITRQSGVCYGYLNGVKSGTSVAMSNNLTGNYFPGINAYGAKFNGYISNARMTKGTAVYTASFTPPTAPLTPTPATILLVNGMNAGAYDATAINDMETVGNAQVSTVQSKFGGSSVYMASASDFLKSPRTSLMAFGTGNFTIEGWIYSVAATALYTCIFTTRDGVTSNANAIFFGLKPTTNQLTFFTSSEIIGTTTAIATGTWTHVALVRNSGATAIYINGVSSGTATFTTALTATGLAIGNEYSLASANGGLYVDDLRVTNGVARYTTTFTPPTQAFPTY